MLICLVGGAVRDMLLGRESLDRDYLVLGATQGQFLKRFPEAKPAGKAFPIFLVNGEEFAFTREQASPSCCCGFGDNDLMNELAADLEARDFTINALALPLPDYPETPPLTSIWEQVVGLPSSLEDIKAKVIRPTGPKALQDDPLRLFRAARFHARFPEFSVSPQTLEAMQQAAAMTTTLAPHRVGTELRKALRSPRPGNFLRLLDATQCLGHWFEELKDASSISAGPQPHHNESVLEHTTSLMDALAHDELLCWMALCHDLGKTKTPRANHPSHHGHEELGIPLARALGKRLALPTRFIQAGEAAASFHMLAARYPELRPGTRVDLLGRLNAKHLTREVFALAHADCGHDHAPLALADLETMLAVTLPEDQRDLGARSGEILREHRCQALARKGG